MIEWILVVWLVSCAGEGPCQMAPAFEVGDYRQLEDCERARDSVRTENDRVSFVANCIERDKQ